MLPNSSPHLLICINCSHFQISGLGSSISECLTQENEPKSVHTKTPYSCCAHNNHKHNQTKGYRGSTMVNVLFYKSEGRWFDPS